MRRFIQINLDSVSFAVYCMGISVKVDEIININFVSFSRVISFLETHGKL